MTVKQTMEAVHISALTQEAQSSVAVGLDIDWPQIAGVVMVRSYYINYAHSAINCGCRTNSVGCTQIY